MATQADFDTVLSAIDAETTRIATKLQDLINQLSTAGGSLSADQEAAILASAQKELDQLKAIGADPTNPVP